MRNARNKNIYTTGSSNQKTELKSLNPKKKKKGGIDFDNRSNFSDSHEMKKKTKKKSETFTTREQMLTSFIQTSFSNKNNPNLKTNLSSTTTKGNSHKYNQKLIPINKSSTSSQKTNQQTTTKTVSIRTTNNDNNNNFKRLEPLPQSPLPKNDSLSHLSFSNLNDSIGSTKSHKTIRVKKLISKDNSRSGSTSINLSSTAFTARPRKVYLSDISSNSALSNRSFSSNKSQISGTPEYMKMMFSKTENLNHLKISKLNESSQLISENIKKGIGVYDYKKNKKKRTKKRRTFINDDTDTEIYYYTEISYSDDESMTEESYSDPETGERKHRMVKRSQFHYLFKIDPLDPEGPMKCEKYNKDEFTSESFYEDDYDFDYEYELVTDEITGEQIRKKIKKINKDKPKVRTKKKRYIPRKIDEEYWVPDPNDKNKMIKKTRKINRKDFTSEEFYEEDYDFDYDYEFVTDEKTGEKIRTKVKKLNKDKPKVRTKKKRYVPKIVDEEYWVPDPNDKTKMIKKTRKINKNDFTSESFYEEDYDFDYDYEITTDEKTGEQIKTKVKKLNKDKPKVRTKKKRYVPKKIDEEYWVPDPKDKTKMIKKTRQINKKDFTSESYYEEDYDFDYDYEFVTDEKTGKKVRTKVKKLNKDKPKVRTKKKRYVPKIVDEEYWVPDPNDKTKMIKKTRQINKKDFTSESFYEEDYDFDYEYEFKTDEKTGEQIKTKVKKLNKDKPKVRTKKKRYVPKKVDEEYWVPDPNDKNKMIKKTRQINKNDFTSESYYEEDYDFDYDYEFITDEKTGKKVRTKVKKLNKNKPKVRTKKKRYVPKKINEEYWVPDPNDKTKMIKKTRQINKKDFTSETFYEEDYDFDYDYDYITDEKTGKKVRTKVKKINKDKPKVRTKKKRYVPKIVDEEYWVPDPNDKTKMIKKTRKINKNDFTSESFYEEDYDFDYDYDYITDEKTGKKVRTKVKKINKDKPKVRTKKKRYVPKTINEEYWVPDPNDKTKMIKKTRQINKKDFTSESYYEEDYDFDYDYELITDEKTGKKVRTKVKKLNKDKPKVRTKKKRYVPKIVDEEYWVPDPKDKNKMIKKTRKINKNDFTSESFYEEDYDFDYDYELITDEKTGKKVRTKVKKLNKDKPKVRTKKKRYVPKTINEEYWIPDPNDKNKMIKKTRQINKKDFTSETYYEEDYDFDYDYELITDEKTGKKARTKVKKLNKDKPKVRTKKKRYVPKIVDEEYWVPDPKDKNKMIKKTRKINKNDFTSESFYEEDYDFDYDYELITDEKTGKKVRTKVKKLNKNKPKIRVKKKRYVPKSNNNDPTKKNHKSKTNEDQFTPVDIPDLKLIDVLSQTSPRPKDKQKYHVKQKSGSKTPKGDKRLINGNPSFNGDETFRAVYNKIRSQSTKDQILSIKPYSSPPNGESLAFSQSQNKYNYSSSEIEMKKAAYYNLTADIDSMDFYSFSALNKFSYMNKVIRDVSKSQNRQSNRSSSVNSSSNSHHNKRSTNNNNNNNNE